MKNNSIKWSLIGKLALDILEKYIPSVMFLALFVSFLLGVFFRYVLNDPQSWTFEVSSICYLAVAVLGWGIAHRTDDNVVFDMLYNILSAKVQCILRIVTNITIAVVAVLMIVPTINYLVDMKDLTTQIIKIPRYLVFLPFLISFISATIRSVYRLVLDIRAMRKQDYVQHYGVKEVSEE